MTLTSKTRTQIKVAEMKALRLINGVTQLNRISNEDIRGELAVEGIMDLVERGQLRWFGDVKSKDNVRYPKRKLEWIPQGRRPDGRPRKR